MASLSDISIKRPVLATVFSIVIVIFGLLGYARLGVREFPSIDPPIITVRTNYTGANAEIIESQITEPIEKAVNGIENVRTISSQSSQGVSTVTVEFNLDANLETAANDVRDKVQGLRTLPKDLDAPPAVSKADANSDAIISMTIQSKTKNQLEVNRFAEDVIQERIQTIPGVSGVQIWGQKTYAMRLRMDPEKMAGLGVTPIDVQNALNAENVELPTGKISGNNTELSIRAMGRFTNVEDFQKMIIRKDSLRTIQFSDIGIAEKGAENEETVLKLNGIPMVAVALVPQPGANYVAIADEFYRRLEIIKKDIPDDYQLDIAMDTTRFITRSIEEVKETLLISFVLVVLIIFLFFRDWLIAIRPLIDIPVSLIGAFFIMYLAGFSINVLTLLAIVLATGLVVDDGIVVTENIFKKIEEGMPVREAAFKGSNEIFFAVISTSITLAVVFLPIIFLQGFVGRLFREFGIVVAGAVLISAFVSLSLTPMLNVKLSRKSHKKSKFYTATEPFFEWLNRTYKTSLNGFLRDKWMAFPIIAAVGFAIFFVGKNLQSELSPLDDRSLLRISATAPEGSSYDYMLNYMDRLSHYIADSVPEARVVLTVTAPGFAGTGAVNSGFGRIVLSDPDQRQRSQMDIYNAMNRDLKSMPEARTFLIQEQTLSSGGGGGRGLPVQYVVMNQDFKKLSDAVPKFLEAASKDPAFSRVDVNLKFNKPELQVTIDRDKARSLGVSVYDIAQTMQLALSGQRLGYFTMGDKQYQVIGQVDISKRDEPADLKALKVRTAGGSLIALENVISVEERVAPPQLFHYDRTKSATISADLAPGHTIGDGIAAMDAAKEKLLDESFTTALSGTSRDYAESGSNTLFAFFLALGLIYLVLAAQFESFIDPFIIMFTVPLAVGGAVLSLFIFGQTLNIFSQIGIIVLLGLVTKNGILIVEFANKKQEEGMGRFDAVLNAAVDRLRPILMTSLATTLGAVPIAFALGAGSASRMPLGIVIIGGMSFSLILTLFVVPAMYLFLSRAHKHNKEIETSGNLPDDTEKISAQTVQLN